MGIESHSKIHVISDCHNNETFYCCACFNLMFSMLREAIALNFICDSLQEVCAVKFNVLVTTYEFIMYDRSKLSKIDWKYIIIDEAQRMKDRESVLARDLDRYRCQRRLLLTGTPLQVFHLTIFVYVND